MFLKIERRDGVILRFWRDGEGQWYGQKEFAPGRYKIYRLEGEVWVEIQPRRVVAR